MGCRLFKAGQIMRLNIPQPISIGESMIVSGINPRYKFFATQLSLTQGATYRFSASGKWKDSCILVGPDGWRCPILEQFNRVPRHRMFLLCGCVGKSLERSFPIGSSLVWPVPLMISCDTDSHLYLFANDWECSYANNREASRHEGCPMQVTITRIK